MARLSVSQFSTRLITLTLILIAVMAAGLSSQTAEADEILQRPLMRFPDVSDSLIVFVYGEDIWTVSIDGGAASRLTIHDGEERYPRFSPDGKLIAFTGEYDGNADVYVMDLYGGNITRVTWHPAYNTVIDWHPTKNKIIFHSGRKGTGDRHRLWLISPDGTGLEEVPLYEVAQGCFSPDGKRIAYNRGSRESRTWKRYRGGTAQDIYLYDFEAEQMSRLTDFEGTDRLPMWIGERIYFSSDRNYTLNIFSYDLPTGVIEQITDHTEYDVRRPSMGGNRIVYELGGEIWLLDVERGTTSRVPVEIRADASERRPRWVEVDDLVTEFNISPTGKRAVIVARGEVFSVPAEEGPTRNLTETSGARERGAVWSPDGSTIAYLSDASGEYEIYMADPKGESEPVQLTEHVDGYRHTLRWSPDNKMLAYTDQTLKLYFIDVDSREITVVDRAGYEDMDVALDRKPISDYCWSPDSRWLAYSKIDADLMNKIYIYSLESGESRCVSTGQFHEINPVFTRNGQHLLFASDRRFDPTFCDFEWEMVFKKSSGIYCLTLQKDGSPLFPFKSDEEEFAEDNEGGDGMDDIPAEELQVVIDFDGLSDRIESLPLPRGNYRELATNEEALFYLNSDDGDYNRLELRPLGPRTLATFSFEDREEATVIEGIDEYRLSADGSHIAYRKGGAIGILESSERDASGQTLDLGDMRMHLDPVAEARQMYEEAWRMNRDYYYNSNIANSTPDSLWWMEMGEKYRRLLPYVSCAQDIDYLIGELVGELSTSHTYTSEGQGFRDAERVNVGLLGVDWAIDEEAGRYRFGKILRDPDWIRNVVPPLLRPGVDINEGDYLLQVNGHDVYTGRNVYSYFENLGNRQVTLLVNNRPSLDNAREYTVKCLTSEYYLRYRAWVEHNRRVVDSLSAGTIGYIHLPDTYTGSARELPAQFWSQTQKKGLVVDGRYNGGGLDSDMVLSRLRKDYILYWTRRHSRDQTSPIIGTRAHMVCLTNRQAGSGGDQLPWEFQYTGMGPVIGTRTWGGLVGVSMGIDLVNGGSVTVPDYRVYDTSGAWIIENVGFVPDIIVDLDPAEMARGYDAQLMTGVEYLLQKIEKDPRERPENEQFPTLR